MDPKSLYWTEDADNILHSLIANVPLEDRGETTEATKAMAERLVQDEHRTEVLGDDVVAAYVVQTPQHLRDGLRSILSHQGIDPDNFRKYFEMHVGREGFRDLADGHAHGVVENNHERGS